MRLTSLFVVASVMSAGVAHAQLAIPGAGEDKFGLIEGARSLTVTTADDGVTFNWTSAKYTTRGECVRLPPHSEALFKCLDSLTNAPFSYNVSAGITGEKGKGAILSKGLFTPGASVAAGFNYRDERPSRHGYIDFYGSVSATVKQLKSASFPPAVASASIDDDAEKTVGFSGGVNRFFSEHFAIGGGGTVKHAVSTPGLQDPISLCETTSATNADGKTIAANDCADGYLAPLLDQWVRTIRVDALYNFNRYGLGDDGDPVPVATVGLIASANVAYRTKTPTTGNLAFGPVLHPKGIPRKALLALIFKVSDVTNAVTGQKKWKERVGATLWFGIPLSGF
jgi:hypothetical protein